MTDQLYRLVTLDVGGKMKFFQVPLLNEHETQEQAKARLIEQLAENPELANS